MGDAHAVTVAAGDRGPRRSGKKARPAIVRTARRPSPASTDARAGWRRTATALLGRRAPAVAAAAWAAGRGRALALVYHRVRPEPAQRHEVVPCVPVEAFRAHVEALRGLGDIVPLDQLPAPTRSPRPLFALTFDDDYATHVRYVLPILRELGAPATFFLSGRSLHGLGPYWWEVLEDRLRRDGPERVARRLEVPDARPMAIAVACENDPGRRRELEADASPTADQLGPHEIAELAGAGMTVGFHTVAHAVLPLLTSPDRQEALTHGRDRLQDLTGQPLTVLAYPHGRADAATAADARAAGYASAWTGAGSAVDRRSDRWRLGRWEAGPVDPRTLRARAVTRLLRSVSADG
jgi:peptidoglycan/xylan/chitin deacetylase (PgdA/CDA1 family)